MRFHMSRVRDFDGNPLQYWNGLRVRAMFYITGTAQGRSFTRRTVITD